MSYLTVELDALNKVPLVATATGLHAADVSHGLLMLWSWCFREGRDVCTDVHLAGFFGVANVGPALEAFDFLERVDGSWRVRGATRYLRIREARSQGGKKGGKRTQEKKRNESHKSEAHLKQNQALKSFGELKQNEALKGFWELKQNEALSPISSSTKKRELAIKASSTPQPEPPAPEPNPATAPSPPSAGALVDGAETHKPRRQRSAAEEVVRKARWSTGHVQVEHLRALEQFVRERNTTLTEAKRWLVELETCPTLTGRKRLDEQPPGQEVLS